MGNKTYLTNGVGRDTKNLADTYWLFNKLYFVIIVKMTHKLEHKPYVFHILKNGAALLMNFY